MAHKRKKKGGMFGLGSDLGQIAIGVGGSLALDMVLNKFAHRGHHRGGAEPPHQDAPHDEPPRVSDNLGDSLNDALQGIEDISGMPKPMIIKGAAAVALLMAAESYPQYGTALKIAAGVTAYQAITSHDRVRRMLGLHGVELAAVATDALNAIEDKVAERITEYKESMHGNVLADNPGGAYSDSMHGNVLADNPGGAYYGHEDMGAFNMY